MKIRIGLKFILGFFMFKIINGQELPQPMILGQDLPQKTLKISNKDEPFELSASVIHSYLNNKLSLHSKNLDQTKLESFLSAYLEDSKIKELVEIIKTCDAGRYSFESSEERKTILKDVNELLVKIDKDLK